MSDAESKNIDPEQRSAQDNRDIVLLVAYTGISLALVVAATWDKTGFGKQGDS